MEAYTEPTSFAFGYVFGLLARLPGLAAQQETLVTVGRRLGAALLAFDCAVDWRRDRRRGEFNPLPDEAAVPAALHFAQERLAEAEVWLVRAFGPTAHTVATLRAVRSRLARLNPLVEAQPCAVPPRRLWAKAKHAARFVLVPVAAGARRDDDDATYDAEPADGDLIGDDRLPGGIENQGQPQQGKKNNNSCCDSDCANCCLCGSQSCECGGNACAGADCCAGFECCACAA
jgi:hypothetical protein